MKLSGIDKAASNYKTCISEFWFQWPEVRSIFRPDHYKAMGKSSNAFLFWKYDRDHANYLKIVLSQTNFDDPYVGLTQLPLILVIRGHLRSNAFFPLTFDRIEIERCGWFQCVSLAETHRLICIMTYLGHDVTSSDLDLRSNFDHAPPPSGRPRKFRSTGPARVNKFYTIGGGR